MSKRTRYLVVYFGHGEPFWIPVTPGTEKTLHEKLIRDITERKVELFNMEAAAHEQTFWCIRLPCVAGWEFCWDDEAEAVDDDDGEAWKRNGRNG